MDDDTLTSQEIIDQHGIERVLIRNLSPRRQTLTVDLVNEEVAGEGCSTRDEKRYMDLVIDFVFCEDPLTRIATMLDHMKRKGVEFKPYHENYPTGHEKEGKPQLVEFRVEMLSSKFWQTMLAVTKE